MSYTHQYHKTYNAGTVGNTTAFVFIVLLVSNVWIHKSLTIEAGHILVFSSLTFLGVIGLLIIYKTIKKEKVWYRSHNPNMLAIDRMTGLEFEHYVAKLLGTKGYNHIRLTEEYDYGVDIIAEKNGIRWGIQVKRYSGLVKADAVRQAVTALKKYHCDRAMVISNSTYSQVAKELARSNNCELVDRNGLLKWVRATLSQK
ncbi:MAG TPA: restriction endonuclease [Patescibacteria group bacterium]|jgi:HJR/Mrr/RecB family endonuclease|nr:restriction endonuclease [Patescibacteria group bacterium]